MPRRGPLILTKTPMRVMAENVEEVQIQHWDKTDKEGCETNSETSSIEILEKGEKESLTLNDSRQKEIEIINLY